MNFNDIDTINPGVSEYLSNNKIVDMTEIQRQTYKHIMSGRDVCACSGTGTGKTLAYLIPIIIIVPAETIVPIICIMPATLPPNLYISFTSVNTNS